MIGRDSTFKRKKAIMSIFLICCSMAVILLGCSRKKAEPFDFSRYYGKSMDVFLKDFGLTEEDFEKDIDYTSKELLPFMDCEALYRIVPDEQNNIWGITVYLKEESLEDAEKLYQKAVEIEKVYEGIKTAANYFDSFEGEPYPKTSQSADEDGSDVTVTDYTRVYSSASDIRKYPTYEEAKKAMEQESIYQELVGIWNLEDSMQVIISYAEMFDQPGLTVSFGNSENTNAVRFGDAQ